MEKKFAVLLLIILAGMGFCSCSDINLPKQVEIEGSINLPFKIVAKNWGAAVADMLREAFFGDELASDEMLKAGGDIYHVDYPGQKYQAFCVYIYSELSEGINPDDYFSEIADVLHTADENPYKLDYEIPIPEMHFEKTVQIPVDLPSQPPFPLFSFRALAAADAPPEDPKTSIVIELDSLGDEFVSAEIDEGEITVSLELPDQIDGIDIKITSIAINQDDSDDGKGGLKIPPSLPPLSLKDKNLNKETMTIDVFYAITVDWSKINIFNLPQNLNFNITVDITIDRLAKLEWKFDDAASLDLNQKHQIDFVNFGQISDYVNYILFDAYDENANQDGKPTTGIGIQFELSKIISDDFEMGISCPQLKFPEGFYQPLVSDTSIIFGNIGDELKLNPSNIENFEFSLELRIKGGSNILTLKGVSTGVKEKVFEGTASFFQNWVEAELNMVSIMQSAGTPNEGTIIGEGTIPDTEPINLSDLKQYMQGFSIGDKDEDKEEGVKFKTKLFLNGPKAISKIKPKLSLNAQYSGKSEPLIPEQELQLDETDIEAILKKDYLKGSVYTKKDLPLPDDGISFSEVFTTILRDSPEDLVFNYQLELPDTITISSEDFEQGEDNSITINSKITATIMIFLPLVLKAEEEPSIITYPGMFSDSSDLFGREQPGDAFLPKNMDVEYISFSVDFTNALFKGGKLFIEKKNNDEENNLPLYPKGIPLNGNKLTITVSSENMRIIKEKLIVPDFRIEFSKGSTIGIPKDMGVTGVKFEAKGKYTLPDMNLGDFLPQLQVSEF
ncbi:MAG: hypothetical protein FWC24_03595 [Treponema sp.]|nr:hypothetical protein [Treponema sp.]